MQNRSFPYLLLLPSLAVLAFVSLYPIFFNVWASFQNFLLYKREITFVAFDNYIELLTSDPRLPSVLFTTMMLLGGVLGIEVPLGIGIGLLLSNEKQGIRFVRTILLFPMIITPIVIGLILKMMLHPLVGIVNYLLQVIRLPAVNWLGMPSTAMLSLILVDTWEFSPFVALVALAGFQSLPRDPYEAAIIDGASRGQVFVHITLPLMRRIILILVMLRTIGIFRMFDQIYAMTSGGPGLSTTTLGFYIYEAGIKWMDYGYGSALSMLMLGIISAFCLIFIRVMK